MTHRFISNFWEALSKGWLSTNKLLTFDVYTCTCLVNVIADVHVVLYVDLHVCSVQLHCIMLNNVHIYSMCVQVLTNFGYS